MPGMNQLKCCCGKCAYCLAGPTPATALVTITGIVACGCHDDSPFGHRNATVFNLNTSFCLRPFTGIETTPCGYVFRDVDGSGNPLANYFRVQAFSDALCVVPVGGSPIVSPNGQGCSLSITPAGLGGVDLQFLLRLGNVGGALQTPDAIDAIISGPLDCSNPIVINSATAASWIAPACGAAGHVFVDASAAEVTISFGAC